MENPECNRPLNSKDDAEFDRCPTDSDAVDDAVWHRTRFMSEQELSL